MASLATIFGSGAMTNSLREIQGTEVLFIIGSNTKETHPVIANMMIAAKRSGSRVIIADPRKVDLCRHADIWLRQRPGSDRVLLNSMAHIIVAEGLQNDDFIGANTTGYEEWRRSLDAFTPEMAERHTGVPKEDIVRAARMYGSSRKAAIYYTMGITQHSHGTANVNAIANLALLTGNIGREHTGITPLRGQNNVQGACDAGCLPNVYPGYQKVSIPEIRAKFENAWASSLSPTPGLAATEVTEQALQGKIRAVYIMGENPVLGDPNVSHTRKGFESLDLLIVQDIFLTETAQMAHVVFPAACFAEKDGTFINTERRVQRVRKAIRPPGEAKEDIWIISELSRRLGYEMNYCGAEDVFDELGGLWPALEGITYSRIERRGIQWPCPTRNHPGTKYLYKGGFPRGNASFTAVPFDPNEDAHDSEYPFVLTTGRNLFQYHFGSMTRRVPAIEMHAGQAYIEIHPDDAERLGISHGSRVRVSSKIGSLTVSARVTPRVRQGETFMPMHYAEGAVNLLTDNRALDTHSKTPRFKVTRIHIEPVREEVDSNG